MPFKLTYTDNTGFKELSVPTAQEAFQEYIQLQKAGVAKVVINDGRRNISYNNLVSALPPKGK